VGDSLVGDSPAEDILEAGSLEGDILEEDRVVGEVVLGSGKILSFAGHFVAEGASPCPRCREEEVLWHPYLSRPSVSFILHGGWYHLDAPIEASCLWTSHSRRTIAGSWDPTARSNLGYVNNFETHGTGKSVPSGRPSVV